MLWLCFVSYWSSWVLALGCCILVRVEWINVRKVSFAPQTPEIVLFSVDWRCVLVSYPAVYIIYYVEHCKSSKTLQNRSSWSSMRLGIFDSLRRLRSANHIGAFSSTYWTPVQLYDIVSSVSCPKDFRFDTSNLSKSKFCSCDAIERDPNTCVSQSSRLYWEQCRSRRRWTSCAVHYNTLPEDSYILKSYICTPIRYGRMEILA